MLFKFIKYLQLIYLLKMVSLCQLSISVIRKWRQADNNLIRIARLDQ